MNLYKNEDFAESIARSLRCCGVSNAHIVQVIAYEVITEPQPKERVS